MLARKSCWLFVGCELILIGCLIGSATATGGSLEDFIYRYQTLITGVAALAAAWFTTATVRRQIAASDRQHTEQRFRAMSHELDALEGLVGYFDRLGEIAPHVVGRGRAIDPPSLNLVHRVSMHTSHQVSNTFSDLMARIDSYNASDRQAMILYGDDQGVSEHSMVSIALMGHIAVTCAYARERVAYRWPYSVPFIMLTRGLSVESLAIMLSDVCIGQKFGPRRASLFHADVSVTDRMQAVLGGAFHEVGKCRTTYFWP